MHILVLSSNQPNFDHSYSHNTVLAVLLEALAETVEQVSWAVACPGEDLDPATRRRLAGRNIRYLGDFSTEIEDAPAVRGGLRRVASHSRKALFPREDDDYPRFRDPGASVARLRRCGADAFVLFWDTWFAHLLPYLEGTPVFGYWAKPRYEASLARIGGVLKTLKENGLVRSPRALGRRWAMRKILEGQRERHFRRARHLAAASNICALDAEEHRRSGSACTYIPNTWPDAFGEDWHRLRAAAMKEHSDFQILGNIGSLHSTGNYFGMNFLATEVLPHLERELNGEAWTVNVYGRGKLSDEIKLRPGDPHVTFRGFVDDIDHEILSNQLFLLGNNAGPYSGGYTRVIYAMSSGTCLIAHGKLAASMPELEHRRNVLLGNSGDEMAALVVEAHGDRKLRERIGAAARETYESRYHPNVVAGQILKLIGKQVSI